MTPDEIRANLTKEQYRFWENILGDYKTCDDDRKEWFKTTPLWHHKLALEALAERNRLLAELQYETDDCIIYTCRDCGRDKDDGCAPNCAIAAALKGVGE